MILNKQYTILDSKFIFTEPHSRRIKINLLLKDVTEDGIEVTVKKKAISEFYRHNV